MSQKTVLLLGASGETGKEVLKQLVSSPSYGTIRCLGRKTLDLPVNEEGWGRVEQVTVDFDALDKFQDKFQGVDTAFCCLGTTRAKAGKEGFVKVDHDYVLGAAKLLHSSGCSSFHLLSSKGANPDSWFLYPSTKGKVEVAVRELGLSRLCVYRPGLLMCDRQESRFGERIAQWVASWADRSRGWSVSTETVARAMVNTSLGPIGAFTLMEHGDVVIAGKEEGST